MAHSDSVPPHLASFARVGIFGTVFLRVSCFAAALAYGRLVYWQASAVTLQMSRHVALMADGLLSFAGQ